MATPRSLEDVVAYSPHLSRLPVPALPDLYAEKLVPSRLLVTYSAKEIAEKILSPVKKPTFAYGEWVASLTSAGLAADFEARNLWLESPVSESNGWRIGSLISGASSWPWGVTFLATDYHDYSADHDVDFMLRLGGLQMALASRQKGRAIPPSPWELARVSNLLHNVAAEIATSRSQEETAADMLSWTWDRDVKMGAVLARVMDSREYGLRTGTLTMSPLLADEFLDYYEGKLRAVGLGVDNEDPHLSLEWDRLNPRDVATGYRFVELEAPTADEDALLQMKWSAQKRKRAAERDVLRSNAEIAVAYNRGLIRNGRFRLPGTGMTATIVPPRRGFRHPYVRYTREKMLAEDD